MYARTGAYTEGGTSDGGATVTHGLTINDGDLVVITANVNDASSISLDAGGATATEAINETPSGETAKHALWWKNAASEPSSYSFSWTGNHGWRVTIQVFSGGSNWEVDAAANSAITGGTSFDLDCSAYDGQVISDNAIAIVCGGKDNRSGSSEPYTQADNSYTGTIGDSLDQAHAAAYRIYGTGETAAGSILLETADAADALNDKTYSIHISFVESGAGNDIAATGSLSVSGSAALSAIGAMAAAGALAVVGAAALTGSGSIACAGSASVTGAAALEAIGNVNAAGSASISGSADLDAQGQVTAAGAASITGSANLTGTIDDMAATGAVAVDGAATLGASGTLTAAGAASITGSADLSAVTQNDVTASGALALTGFADLSALGELAGTGAVSITGSEAALTAGDATFGHAAVGIFGDHEVVGIFSDHAIVGIFEHG